MPSLLSRLRLSVAHLDAIATAKNSIVLLSFILPISILYLLNPNSFQLTWKGRAPYFLFLLFFFIELLMAREKLPKKIFGSIKRKNALAIAATTAAPTIYVISVSFLGMNSNIQELGRLVGATLLEHWPISFEYLLFMVFFTTSIQLIYGIKGLKRFLVSLFFLGATGFFYMIDTFYPYGTITALQSFVPSTASSATLVLGWMSYGTLLLSGPDGAVHMLIAGPHGGGHWYTYWPSAGIHSLLIYTLVILFFIKKAPFSPQWKVIYASIPRKLRFIAKNKRISFLLEHRIIHTAIMATETLFIDVLRQVPLCLMLVIGAVGTFIANVLRIVTICTIGSKIGSDAAQLFHNYYGELYFIAWIIIYLIILLLLERKIYIRLEETG